MIDHVALFACVHLSTIQVQICLVRGQLQDAVDDQVRLLRLLQHQFIFMVHLGVEETRKRLVLVFRIDPRRVFGLIEI